MVVLSLLTPFLLPIRQSYASDPSWNFNKNPAGFLDDVKTTANDIWWDSIQNTKLDRTTSKMCGEIEIDSKFSISRTLCYVKEHISAYFEYVMFIGLSAATILIIRNGFNLVTASDRSKQFGVFKKNMMYIIIWVILLVAFYYILDIYISMVNLVAE